ncbi:MAG: lipase family protein [Candidatus Kapabacteria bacterium]|nr:lipase family protein [Candidatus Kapabacteria bacterium]
MKITKIMIIIWLFFLFSCSKENTNPVNTYETVLISFEFKQEFSIEQLEQISKLLEIELEFKHPIDAFKLVYYTKDAMGKQIKASGLVLIPKNLDIVPPVISFQHGSYSKKTDGAASNLGFAALESLYPAAFGYIVFVADYIGFGESSDKFHPYHHYQSTVNACVDMLRAAYEFLNQKKIQYDKKLFLMGYSQGGYSSIALNKAISDLYPSEFKVTATSAGAGAYNLYDAANFYLNQNFVDYPCFIPYILLGMEAGENKNFNLSKIFNPPFDSRIRNLFDGTLDLFEINRQLSYSIKILVKQEFLDSFNSSGEEEIKSILKKNSVDDWSPKNPIFLFHSTGDEIVPYSISEKTYEKFKQNGSNSIRLELLKNNQISHEDAFILWGASTINFFKEF